MKVILALFAVSSVAMGAQGLEVKALDKDKNGLISVKEATEHASLFNAFKTLDTNKDGNLDAAEIAKFQPEASKKAEAPKKG